MGTATVRKSVHVDTFTDVTVTVDLDDIETEDLEAELKRRSFNLFDFKGECKRFEELDSLVDLDVLLKAIEAAELNRGDDAVYYLTRAIPSLDRLNWLLSAKRAA